MFKIFIGADHAGFSLKEFLKERLVKVGYELEDKGAFSLDPKDDYPDFIRPVAEAVDNDPGTTFGIIIGGSGQGEAMLANRYKNVRAVVFYGGPDSIITLSREHNNANILSLGARFLDDESAYTAVTLWLRTDFSEESRHIQRLNKMNIAQRPSERLKDL